MSQLLTARMALAGSTAEGSATFTVAPRFGMDSDVDGGLAAVASALGCKPLTAAKVFSSSMPASYPGHAIPSSVTHPLATIRVRLTASAPWISDADQAGLAAVFGSMPKAGVPMVTINQEGEAGRFGYSAAQVAGSHQRAYGIFRDRAPANAVYCQDFETYSASPQGRGSGFSPYVCCAANGYDDLPLYLLDWYPSSPSTDAAGSVMPAFGYIRSLVPHAPIGIAECNYTTQISTGTTWAGGSQAQWFADAWAWALANDMLLFIPYFLTAHGVPWPPDQTTLTELSAIARASGL